MKETEPATTVVQRDMEGEIISFRSRGYHSGAACEKESDIWIRKCAVFSGVNEIRVKNQGGTVHIAPLESSKGAILVMRKEKQHTFYNFRIWKRREHNENH